MKFYNFLPISLALSLGIFPLDAFLDLQSYLNIFQSNLPLNVSLLPKASLFSGENNLIQVRAEREALHYLCLRYRPDPALPRMHQTDLEPLRERIILLCNRRQISEAILLAEELVHELSQQLGSEHLAFANGNQLLGRLYFYGEMLDQAVNVLQIALRIQEASLGENNTIVAETLELLASTYEYQENWPLAIATYERYLPIQEAILGSEDSLVVFIRELLADLYWRYGDYARAEQQRQTNIQAGEITVTDFIRELNRLARDHIVTGNYAEAERLLELAISAERQRAAGHSNYAIESLFLLSKVQFIQKKPEQAFRQLQIAAAAYGGLHMENCLLYFDICQEEANEFFNDPYLNPAALLVWLPGQFPDAGIGAAIKGTLASFYLTRGEYEKAKVLVEGAMYLHNNYRVSERYSYSADIFTPAIALYMHQGRYDIAELIALDIIAQAESISIYHNSISIGNNLLARSAAAQRKFDQAVHYRQKALSIEEHNIERFLLASPESRGQSFIAALSTMGDSTLSLHMQGVPEDLSAARLALMNIFQRKGRLLDAASDRSQFLQQVLNAEEREMLSQLADIRRQLSTYIYARPDHLSNEQYQNEISRLSRDENRLETALARRSAAFRVETQPIEIDTIAQYLPPDSALIEFVRYRPHNFERNTVEADRYAAYILRPGGHLQWADLGEAEVIDDAIATLSDQLYDPTSLPATAARQLAVLIMNPIAAYIDGVEHLLISPDSQLNRLPFEVLVTAQGQHLIERHLISYLGSGRDLRRLADTPASRQGPVLVGNPDYDSTAVPDTMVAGQRGTSSQRSSDLTQLQFAPLPGTAREVNAIAPLWPNATVLKQQQATESALKQVTAPRILHIATHGFFLDDLPLVAPAEPFGLASLGMAVDGLPLAPPVPSRENPLLRSGLALAGFNQRRSGDEDGVLTALEAASLDLYGTQLVVLSACDTGVGQVANGEGIYGLRRAFAMAGAQSQLLSLWQVSDNITADLMIQYYQALTRGVGRAEALRQAQLHLMQGAYSHPYYWSAFILSGDWRPLD